MLIRTTTIVAGVVALTAAFSGVPTSRPSVTLRVLSSRPEFVSGGDALIGIDLADYAVTAGLRVTVNGRDASHVFHEQTPGHYRGLIEGLAAGLADRWTTSALSTGVSLCSGARSVRSS